MYKEVCTYTHTHLHIYNVLVVGINEWYKIKQNSHKQIN